jgi:hypothetical protein
VFRREENANPFFLSPNVNQATEKLLNYFQFGIVCLTTILVPIITPKIMRGKDTNFEF